MEYTEYLLAAELPGIVRDMSVLNGELYAYTDAALYRVSLDGSFELLCGFCAHSRMIH
jgi:hypothetical protein